MIRTACSLVIVAVLATVDVKSALAQIPPPPPVPVVPQEPIPSTPQQPIPIGSQQPFPMGPQQPVPLAPQQQPGTLPPIALPPGSPQPPAGNDPFVPATAPFQLNPNPPPPCPDPGQSVFTCCGLYGSLEISLLFPDLHGSLSGAVPIMGVFHPVDLGSANLNATGSPRLEVGYRLGEGVGAVAGVYRSIVSQGGSAASSTDFLATRLNINVFDIDYVSPAYNFAPLWDFSYRGGIRIAAAYFDNQLTGTTQQLATSNFIGAGPHVMLEVGRALYPIPGLGVEAKLDGAVLIGNEAQSFETTLSPTLGGTVQFNQTRVVPVLTFDLGLTYTPPCGPNWARFSVGYQFEYWWDIGSGGASKTDLGINGLYFRGEFNF